MNVGRARRAASLVGVILVITLAACGGDGGGGPKPTVVPRADAPRLAGRTDAETAAMVSAVRFPTASDVVVVRADRPLDAVGAAYIAGSHQSPVLLTGRDAVPAATLGEIERLGAYKAWVIGAAGVIAESALDELRGAGVEVVRVDGADATEVAVAASEASGAANVGIMGGRGHTALLVATSDARFGLVAGPLSFSQQWPVLLTGRDALPEVTRAALGRLGVTHVVVVGDAAVVGDAVVAALTAVGVTSERAAGPTPAAVAVGLAGLAERIGLPVAPVADVAPAGRPVDVLVAGPHAALGAPVLLCEAPDDCGAVTLGWLAVHREALQRVVVVGDDSATSEAARRGLDAAVA